MRTILIHDTEYSMMALKVINEFFYLPLYERVEEYEFLDFNDMYSGDSVHPYGKYLQGKSNNFAYDHVTDYYKEFFSTFNPEDNDSLISTDEGML